MGSIGWANKNGGFVGGSPADLKIFRPRGQDLGRRGGPWGWERKKIFLWSTRRRTVREFLTFLDVADARKLPKNDLKG
jgi:hypothetical protein